MRLLRDILRFIQTRGVSDENNGFDQMTKMLNVLSFFTALGGSLFLLVNVFFFNEKIYTIIVSSVIVLYSFFILLNHFKKTHAARIYLTTIVPLWYSIMIFTIGGHFSQSIAGAACVFNASMTFKKSHKLRYALIIYNLLLFVLPTVYIAFYQPIFGVRDVLLDEVLIFLLCVGWISTIFSMYEKKTSLYISNLKHKNKELEQKTNELERFNHIASHDLKSPLRNISSFLTLLKRDLKSEKYDNIDEYVDFVQSNTIQMRDLIEGVLEISHIGNPNNKNYNKIDLNVILKKTTDNLATELKAKNAEISATELPNFKCYEVDLIMLFQNLIQNGIKYNRSSKPRITITAEETPKDIFIYFKDNGIGIAEEYHNQIFEYFKRLHAATEFTGTGLGLGICKKIVNKYNGSISIDSEVGLYTTFIIQLPKNKKTSKNKKSGIRQSRDRQLINS